MYMYIYEDKISIKHQQFVVLLHKDHSVYHSFTRLTIPVWISLHTYKMYRWTCNVVSKGNVMIIQMCTFHYALTILSLTIFMWKLCLTFGHTIFHSNDFRKYFVTYMINNAINLLEFIRNCIFSTNNYFMKESGLKNNELAQKTLNISNFTSWRKINSFLVVMVI